MDVQGPGEADAREDWRNGEGLAQGGDRSVGGKGRSQMYPRGGQGMRWKRVEGALGPAVVCVGVMQKSGWRKYLQSLCC